MNRQQLINTVIASISYIANEGLSLELAIELATNGPMLYADEVKHVKAYFNFQGQG